MVVSSIRKLGFTGVAAVLLISGLAASTLTAQAADNPPGSMTLLQSPAVGSLSSLGGVQGYVASQSGGDINGWLTNQGIDPSAAGPITDTTIPDAAKDAITVDDNMVSLASDATDVNVGYLVGDAMGSDILSASLSNMAVAAGHEDDTFAMNQNEYLTWLNGTAWHGHYTLEGYADFDFTVTWSLDGGTVTPDDDDPADMPYVAQLQAQINKGAATPGALPLAAVLSASQPYSWNQSIDVPYSFAYGVGQALTPGGSVGVDLQDIVSRSSLDGFNIDNAQTSGALSDLSLVSWLPANSLLLLSQLPEFSGLEGTMTTADLASMIMSEIIGNGAIDPMVASFVITEVNSLITTVNNGGSGYVLQPLDDASQATIVDNTSAVLSMFLDDGFSDQLAQAMSANIQLESALNAGTVTTLTPTGVTVAADPAEVDTDASTLTLSASEIVIDPHAACQGNPIESPESVTATATVVDTTGAPVVGATVTFGVEDPLMLDNATQTTDENGVATAIITLPYELAAPAITSVTAHVDFGSGADLNPASLQISPIYYVSPAPPALTVVPTTDYPVFANGEDTYTASITFRDGCGVAQPDIVVDFSVTGSAQLSDISATSDEQGYVGVTLTDEVAEVVTVSATSDQSPIGEPVTVTFTEVASPSPSPSESPTASASESPSESTTASPSASPSESLTTSPSASPSESPSESVTPSQSVSPSASPSESPSQTPTQSASPTGSPSQSPTQSASPTGSPSQSVTASPSQSVTTTQSASPTGSPTQSATGSPTQSVTASPSQSVTATQSASPTLSPSSSPTLSPSVTPSGSPSQSVTPTQSTSPSPSPSQSATTPAPSPSQSVAPVPASGTLTLDPAELNGGGSVMAIATVVNAQGQPIPDVAVAFQIGGNAQFVNDSIAWTDPSGQATVLITTTTLDCDNPGFDVYASLATNQFIQLSGSPARVTIIPPDGACDVSANPPIVKLANATIIAGNATPLASVQVLSASGTLLGTSRVDMTGYWSIPTPAGIPSQQITANEISKTGNQSAGAPAWLDTDMPAPARIDQADTQQVAGNPGAVESSATLTVIFPDGTMIMALANADGSYSVATPGGISTGGVVTVIVTDIAGNPSAPATANLVHYMPPPAPTVTASVQYPQVEVGGRQTVIGNGFVYRERVTAQFCTTTCSTVGTGLADRNGRVSITFTVPTSTPLGSYTVTLTGPTSGSASTTFDVIAPTAPPATKCCAYLLWWAKWWWLFV